jgi:hypothetical protein
MACNNCNETQDPNCGCTTEALHINQICNPIVCPSDECAESFSAACIRYTGDDLVCDNVTVVEADTNISQALSNIVAFICADTTGTTTVVESGDNNIEVTSNTVGNTTTYTVSLLSVPAKEFFYQEVIQDNDISVDPGFVSLQYFSPVGYNVLSYTNTSSVAKTYKVHASYQHSVGAFAGNREAFESWVDAALIKTIGMVNTVQYESLGQLNISGFLFYGPNANNVIGVDGTPIHELFDNQGSTVEFRFGPALNIPLRGSFFKSLTLNPNETVTLMFRAKEPTSFLEPAASLLNRAQMMVEEI